MGAGVGRELMRDGVVLKHVVYEREQPPGVTRREAGVGSASGAAGLEQAGAVLDVPLQVAGAQLLQLQLLAHTPGAEGPPDVGVNAATGCAAHCPVSVLPFKPASKGGFEQYVR